MQTENDIFKTDIDNLTSQDYYDDELNGTSLFSLNELIVHPYRVNRSTFGDHGLQMNTEYIHELGTSYAEHNCAFKSCKFEWQRDCIGFFDYYHNLWLVAAVMYLPLLFLGQRYMSTRQAINVPKAVLFIWNLSLAVFSMGCVYHILPEMIKQLGTYGLNEGVCTNNFSNIAGNQADRWRFYFAMSKLPEMFDTVWLVIRKKPVGFLHYWHHLTVMTFGWHMIFGDLSNEGGDGTYFTTMNCFVHSVMYTYYAFSTYGYLRYKKVAISITTIQILQMVVGLSLVIYKTTSCDSLVYWQNVAFSWLIYGSYLYLFCEYFFNRYFTVKSKVPTKNA